MTKARTRPDPGTAPPWSSLYCRTNGFMLGLFVGLIRYRFARPLFAQQRTRILDFLAEAGLDIPVPADPDAYAEQADALTQQLTLAAFERSPELGRFLYIGASSVLDASMRAGGVVESDDLRDAIVGTLSQTRLDGERIYERFLAEVARERTGAKPRVLIDHVLSPALRLLRDAIEPLEIDQRTAFVAMPFKPPYAGYFNTFYRPLANALEATALRMWGGLSGEDYVDLMLAVMRRSGTVIVELSELNPNVIFELGAARAMDKRLALLVQRRFTRDLPANVRSEQLLLAYSPRERGWPSPVVFRAATQVLAIELGQEQVLNEMRRFHRKAGEALPIAGPELPDLPRVKRRPRRAE